MHGDDNIMRKSFVSLVLSVDVKLTKRRIRYLFEQVAYPFIILSGD